MKRIIIATVAIMVIMTIGVPMVYAECDHDWQIIDRDEATCQGEGYINYECTKCGDWKSETIPKTNHVWKFISKGEATCQDEGCIDYSCTNCGEWKSETIPKTDHVWESPDWWSDDLTTFRYSYMCKYCTAEVYKPIYIKKKKSRYVFKTDNPFWYTKKEIRKNKVKFKSSNKKVASVNKYGKVKAKKKGKAIITAKEYDKIFGGYEYTKCMIVVK